MVAKDGAGTETRGSFGGRCRLSDHRQRKRIARQTFVPCRRRRLARSGQERAAASRVREAGAISGSRDFRRKGHLANGAAAVVCVCGDGTSRKRSCSLASFSAASTRTL